MEFKDIQTLPLRTVERLYVEGSITQEVWEKYAHVWQTGAPRFELRVCNCETCKVVFSHLPLTGPKR